MDVLDFDGLPVGDPSELVEAARVRQVLTLGEFSLVHLVRLAGVLSLDRITAAAIRDWMSGARHARRSDLAMISFLVGLPADISDSDLRAEWARRMAADRSHVLTTARAKASAIADLMETSSRDWAFVRQALVEEIWTPALLTSPLGIAVEGGVELLLALTLLELVDRGVFDDHN